MSDNFKPIIEKIEHYFSADENVVWVGQPNEKVRTTSAKIVPFVGVSSLTICLCCVLLMGGNTLESNGIFQVIAVFLFVVIPCIVVGYALLKIPATQKKVRSRYYYILTSNHVFFVNLHTEKVHHAHWTDVSRIHLASKQSTYAHLHFVVTDKERQTENTILFQYIDNALEIQQIAEQLRIDADVNFQFDDTAEIGVLYNK